MPAKTGRAPGGDAPAGLTGGRSLLSASAQLAVGVGLSLFTRSQCRLRLTRDPAFTLHGPAIVVFPHKRDLDIPLLVRALLGPSTWRTWPGRVAFVGTSELYLTGFLGLYFPQLGPVRRWLAGFNLGPILRVLRVVPVSTPGPRLVAVWLMDLAACFGVDHPIAALLSPDGMAGAAQAGVAGTATLAEAMSWRHRAWLAREVGPELLRPPVYRRLGVAAAHRAPSQVAALAAELEAGNVLVLAPEGNLSPDGGLLPFRSGLSHLLRTVSGVSVIPVGISYDLLQPGRPVAFVRLGRPLTGLGSMTRGECQRVVRRQLARLTTITLAQLAGSAILDELDRGVTLVQGETLARRIVTRARELAGSGYAVDMRLLRQTTFQEVWDRFLHCAGGYGLSLDGTAVRLDRQALHRPVAGWSQNPLGYARNELAWVLDAGSPTSDPGPLVGGG